MNEQEMKAELIKKIDYKDGDKILIIRTRKAPEDRTTIDRLRVNISVMETIGLLYETIRVIQTDTDKQINTVNAKKPTPVKIEPKKKSK